MRLDLAGHPTHTRALSVALEQRGAGELAASADLVDLRKRGFCPVGSALQGAGIIHQMGLNASIDAASRTLKRIDTRMPVVAFEASSSTRGETCRDVAGGLAPLAGTSLDEAAARLRRVYGGPFGCSHVLTLAQLLLATAAWAIERGEPVTGAAAPADDRVPASFRRDLVFDGCEPEDGRMIIAIQLGDLSSTAGHALTAPIDRFASHEEARLRLELNGWPATVDAIAGAVRRRTRSDFNTAGWRDRAATLAPLRGLSLGRGATQALLEALKEAPPLRDALLQLGPALIQCRASFPDKWLNVAATGEDHPGLIGIPDSCYMWRRGGALERIRSSRRRGSGNSP